MRTIRIAVAAAVSAVALTVSGCGSTSDLDTGGAKPEPTAGYQLKAAAGLSGSVQAIKDKGKLIVGTKFDQPGFGLQNPTTEQVEGFDAEIARLIAIKIFGDPDKVEFKEAKTAVREQVIQNGE